MIKKIITGIECDVFKIPKTLEDINGNYLIEFNVEEIPKGIEYVVSEDDEVIKAIVLGIQYNKTVLIKGEKGTGKTSGAIYVSQELNRHVLYMQLTGSTTVDEFLGCYLIKDGRTYWVDGILAKAMKYGYVLILDEVNMPNGEITAILHSVMDDRRILVQGTKDIEENNIIKAHPNFRIIATMNPSDEGGYTGTKEMNESLLDRFKIVVEAKYPEVEKEVKILESKKSIFFKDNTKTFDEDGEVESKKGVLTRFAMIAKEVRNTTKLYTLSTRNLIDWAELCNYVSIREAFKLTFKNKMDTITVKQVEALIDKYFTPSEKVVYDKQRSKGK